MKDRKAKTGTKNHQLKFRGKYRTTTALKFVKALSGKSIYCEHRHDLTIDQNSSRHYNIVEQIMLALTEKEEQKENEYFQ